jgi:hypothetical protein
MPFSVRAIDLARLNSATKYPSIPTFHALDPQTGAVLDDVRRAPGGEIIATEKVDGVNTRIILLPDGNYLIGSREELLHAKGDLIFNPALGIVAAVRAVADRLPAPAGGEVVVVYGEVFGGKVTSAAKQYTSRQEVGYRVFDAARFPDCESLLARPPEEIAAWREAGGQQFLDEDDLLAFAESHELKPTPRIARFPAADLPRKVDAALTFLEEMVPTSRCRLDAGAGGDPEGLVIRSPDRAYIVKLRFEDYLRAKRKKKR